MPLSSMPPVAPQPLVRSNSRLHSRKFSPEIVSRIFFFLNLEYLSSRIQIPLSFALVGRDWFSAWLPYGWKSLKRLGRILGVLEAVERGEIKAKYTPPPEVWTRFERVYAPHLQKIVIEKYSLHQDMARKLFRLFRRRYPDATTFPPLAPPENTSLCRIFPNLRTIRIDYLSWADNESTSLNMFKFAYLISHPSVTQFSLREHDHDLKRLGITFDSYNFLGYTYSVGGGTGVIEAHIGDFVVRGPTRYKKWMAILAGAFTKTSAKCFYLPEIGKVRRAIRARGYIKESIVFNHAVHPYQGLPEHVDVKQIPVLYNPFRTLAKVDLQIGIYEAIEFISLLFKSDGSWGKEKGYWLLRGIRFELKFPDPYRRDIRLLKKLFEGISTCAPFVQELRIIVKAGEPSITSTVSTPKELMSKHEFKVTSDVLCALERCPGLRIFEFRDLYPLLINNVDLEMLIHYWTELRDLSLAPLRRDAFVQWEEGGRMRRSRMVKSLGLDALKVLARRCPMIERLALLFEGSLTVDEVEAWVREDEGAVYDWAALERLKRFKWATFPVVREKEGSWVCLVGCRGRKGKEMKGIVELGG
ncbi:hypothetical protein PM082_018256 [Marasmius tenuissimus]|nr:hypothetical protein PM082_018256 [Marasmius tenuissimus]